MNDRSTVSPKALATISALEAKSTTATETVGARMPHVADAALFDAIAYSPCRGLCAVNWTVLLIKVQTMQTRKHPRTMSEAFGPYTDHNLHPLYDPEDDYILADRLMYAVGVLALAVVFYVVLTS